MLKTLAIILPISYAVNTLLSYLRALAGSQLGLFLVWEVDVSHLPKDS